MRIEIINGQRVEFADDGNWLHDSKPDGQRYFTDSVYLGKDAEPWAECTNEEKEQWEHDHPQPKPEQEGGEV